MTSVRFGRAQVSVPAAAAAHSPTPRQSTPAWPSRPPSPPHRTMRIRPRQDVRRSPADRPQPRTSPRRAPGPPTGPARSRNPGGPGPGLRNRPPGSGYIPQPTLRRHHDLPPAPVPPAGFTWRKQREVWEHTGRDADRQKNVPACTWAHGPRLPCCAATSIDTLTALGIASPDPHAWPRRQRLL
jgi:hypothetical protein